MTDSYPSSTNFKTINVELQPSPKIQLVIDLVPKSGAKPEFESNISPSTLIEDESNAIEIKNCDSTQERKNPKIRRKLHSSKAKPRF